MSTDGFPVMAGSLPGALGISGEHLRELRQQLTEGTDWVLKKKRVRFSDAGMARLREILNLPPESPGPASQTATAATQTTGPILEKTAPAPNAAQADALNAVVTLHVWQTVKNSRILEAFVPGTDPHQRKNIVRVRVRDSKNFMRFVHEKPMELKARHLGADLYELATPCPRYKGRY